MPKIRLEILIDDPGEWCLDPMCGHQCELFVTDTETFTCAIRHRPEHKTFRVADELLHGWVRPQSCKDSEKHD